MTKRRMGGLRRAMTLAALLAIASSSAQAAASSTFLTVSVNPGIVRATPASFVALVRGFGNGVPTGTVWIGNSDISIGGDHVVHAAGAGNPIAAGLAHTCALTPASGVKCWGDGLQGQLGDGTGENRSEPVDVIGVTGAIELAAGSQHTCALLDTGAVKCWGKDFGLTAVAVPLITNARVIAANGGHTCAVTATGGVKCWGLNGSGQLGNGSTDPSAEPVDVVGLDSGAITVAAGYTHSCAITAAGPIKCWGSNDQGKLGGGSNVGAFSTTPIDVAGGFEGFVYITAGENHTCASRFVNLGSVICWGGNSVGQLGNGDDLDHSTPVGAQVFGAPVGLYAGGSHTCTVYITGDVYCWGSNSNGQIGNGQDIHSKLPSLVATLGGKASVLALGGRHSCALMETGIRECWGDNGASQYGNGLDQSVNTPVSVTNLPIAVFAQATATFGGPAGTYTISASYHNGNYDPSSAEVTRVVFPAPTTLTLASSPNPSKLGQNVTFTASLNQLGISGTMELWRGSERLGVTQFLNQGSISFANLPIGTHDVTATVTFDNSNFVPPTPAGVQQTVLPGPTGTTLTASPQVVGPEQPVILVAQVAPVAAINSPVTGSVTFQHDTQTLGTAAIVDGVAQLDAGTWPIGTHTFTASYSGSANFQPSTGSGSATVDYMAGAAAAFNIKTGSLTGTRLTAPAAVRLSNGRFVVLVSVDAKDRSKSGTYFQIYSPEGLPVGRFTGVVPTLIGQNDPSIGAAGNGFVIVFTYRPEGAPAEIWGMRVSALGALLGSEFKINTTARDHIQAQQVAGLKNGGFVVVWSAGPDRGDSGEIFAQRYDSNGRKVSGEFIVNTRRKKTQAFPAVAALPDGGFVVVWSSDASDGNSDIHGQRYAANGARVGTEIKITDVAGQSEHAPSLAAFHDGGFVVAWTGDPAATVYAKRFAASGLPAGAAFVVGQPNYSSWDPIALTVLDDDRYLIGYSNSGDDIYARLFGPGTASSGEFPVNAASSATVQYVYPAAVALSDRNVFMMWEMVPGGKNSQVQLRRLDLPTMP